MIRHIAIIAALLIATAQAAAAPLCWPSTVGGSGTQYWTHEIVPDAIDNAPAGTAAIAVWWHCPDPTAASGWQTNRLLCHRERLAECMAAMPRTLLPAALAAAWPASSPESLGLSWAEAIMWQDFAKATVPPKPSAEVWWVAKAASNANPTGTRPTYEFTAPSTIKIDGGRVAEGSACNCAGARVSVGTSTYCSVLNTTAKVAVCVKQP